MLLKWQHRAKCNRFRSGKYFSTLISKSHSTKFREALKYGQPVFATHPHLFKSGELLPGIPTSEFIERRIKVMDVILKETEKLCSSGTNSVLIIPSATKKYMTENIPYVFRQNSDFLYLSGCLEPDTALILSGTSLRDHTSTILVRDSNEHSEIWEGPRTGTDAAESLFSVDEAYKMENMEFVLDTIALKNKNYALYYEKESPLQPALHKIIEKHVEKYKPKVYESSKRFVQQVRLIKSANEQALMRKSCEIASQAFVNCMATTKAGMTEHQLYARMDFECRTMGAEILAYPPVVASGNNATVIHYVNNMSKISDGDMILMDAGCEYHGYSSDITRTWPVSGSFNDHQRVLYEVILETQQSLIKHCESTKENSMDQLYQMFIKILGKYLQLANILPTSVSSFELDQRVRTLCPHHVGHYLGMDVHDTYQIPKTIPLMPGMIITIEPGVYVRKDNCDVPEEFRGIGIRIEDNVLITDDGVDVLSAPCPKIPKEIEEVVKSCPVV